MRSYAYDFHIHTALSPCGDESMTPHNIVNLCKLNGLDVIAITDHNTCGNCQAVMEIGAKNNLLVIPGMEIESIEEFHSIALFPNLECAKQVEEMLKRYKLKIKNKIKVFGNQCYLNAKDEIIGEEEWLLVTAIQLSAAKIYEQIKNVGGIIYPAHIDKNSYSIISNLGMIPEELTLSAIEISTHAKFEKYADQYKQYHILTGSDAHYLEQLCKPLDYLELEHLNLEKVLEKISHSV